MPNLAREAAREARAEVKELLRPHEWRTPWHAVSIVNGVLWPVLLYTYLYFISFGGGGLRFYSLLAAVVCGPLPCFVACAAVTRRAHRQLREAAPARGLVTLSACLWAAFVSALVSGDQNFWWNMQSYYSFQDLATYVNLDPRTDKGQTYMDAGQVYFKDGTDIAREELVAFRSGVVYCAAPIVGQMIWNQDGASQVDDNPVLDIPLSGTVDFWAVGIDCCNESTHTFACGAAGDPRARAGLRLLRDDVRPFYMMAVQEWTARLCPVNENTVSGQARKAPPICLPARHPLFFHWVDDPIQEVDGYYNSAARLYSMHVFLFFMGDLLLVLLMLWGLFKLGLR